MPALLGVCMLLLACGTQRKLQGCEPGDEVGCFCEDGESGSQRCAEDRRFDACDCSDARRACDPGDERDCECLDGRAGVQVCSDAGGYAACTCATDAGTPMPDGGGGGDGCTSPADRDGDGLSDCAEISDGDAWTDPDVFNGLTASLRNSCGDAGASCDAYGDVAVSEACAIGAPKETRDQYAGWDFGSAAAGDSCVAGYGFGPAFSTCMEPFSVMWDGYIQLQSGMHCFAVSAGRADSCGALYLSATPEASFPGWSQLGPLSLFTVYGLPTESAYDCRMLNAGVYPIRLFFDAWGPDQAFRVRYCKADGDSCAPGRALPSGMLRPTP